MIGENIELIGFHHQDRYIGEPVDPAVVGDVKAVQVFRIDGLFVVPVAVLDPGDKGISGCFQVDDQVRWAQVGSHDGKQVTVILPVALVHIAHLVQIVSENFHILIDCPVLDYAAIFGGNLALITEAMVQEIDLQIERPALHVTIEITQVGIIGHRFVEWFPAHLLSDNISKCGFADADIAGDADEGIFNNGLILIRLA